MSNYTHNNMTINDYSESLLTRDVLSSIKSQEIELKSPSQNKSVKYALKQYRNSFQEEQSK